MRDVKQAGFTLIELMIVVALVALLGSVALPSWEQYQYRARTVEAKIGLASIYTAEKSFSIEKDSFTACLRQAGAFQSGDSNLRYYAMGIPVDTSLPGGANQCGPKRSGSCFGYVWDDTSGDATSLCDWDGAAHGSPYNADAIFFPTAGTQMFPGATVATTILGGAGVLQAALIRSNQFQAVAVAVQQKTCGCDAASTNSDNWRDPAGNWWSLSRWTINHNKELTYNHL